jgi:hypothetical protein
MSYNKEEANRLDAIEALDQLIDLAELAKYQLAEFTTTNGVNLPKIVKLAEQATALATEFASLKDHREHKKFLDDHFKLIVVS